MSDLSLSYDAVGDGLRTHARKSTLLFAGLMGVFAAAELYYGNPFEAFESAMFGAWFWIADRAERGGWVDGYTAAVMSTGEQLFADAERAEAEVRDDAE